jgi:hypothetical protein
MPYEKRLMTALNSGQPYALRASGWFGFARALKSIVEEIESTRQADMRAQATAAGHEAPPRRDGVSEASMMRQGAEA